jgi:uncharacterized membrane protein YgcG
MRSMVWRFTLTGLLLVLLAAPGLTTSIAAQSAGRSVTWQRYDVDLDVQSNGSLVVTETQAITFNGIYQQGYRLVPLDRTTGVTDVSVDEVVNGRPVGYVRGTRQPNTYAATVGSDGLQIDWWFSPTPASATTRTFDVRYTVSGAIRIYEAGDQLQWRAVYADRDGAVDAATVTVHLPNDAAADAVQSAWYRYQPGGTIGALPPVGPGTQLDARTTRFTLGPLAARQGAEVRVQFPHGLIAATPPAWQAQADRADWVQQSAGPIGTFLSLLLTLAIAAGGGTMLVLLWVSRGRDPAVGTVPRRLTEPPSDLPAPLAGTLVDEVASQREAVATLVDLGERGLLRVVDEQNPQLVGSQLDVRITLDAALDDPRLRPYERVLLVALFGPSPAHPAEVRLSGVKQQFALAIPTIEARLYEAVAQAGLFVTNPESTRRRYRAIGGALAGVGAVLAIGAAVLLGQVVAIGWLPGAALALVGLALVGVAGSMPRRTSRGALEAARWRAFGAYLAETAGAHQPATPLPPGYLPYAVAFGVDQSFVRHLESVGSQPPRWYGGWPGAPGPVVFMPGGWYGGPWMGPQAEGRDGSPDTQPGGGVAAPAPPNPQGWSNALAALLTAASEAMAHGGGSGGWSGGGFGGGGGGGGGSGGFR